MSLESWVSNTLLSTVARALAFHMLVSIRYIFIRY